jgi:hypothetical protein
LSFPCFLYVAQKFRYCNPPFDSDAPDNKLLSSIVQLEELQPALNPQSLLMPGKHIKYGGASLVSPNGRYTATITADGDVQVQLLQRFIDPATGLKKVVPHILISLAGLKNPGAAVVPLNGRQGVKPKKAEKKMFFLPVKTIPGIQVFVTKDCMLKVRLVYSKSYPKRLFF